MASVGARKMAHKWRQRRMAGRPHGSIISSSAAAWQQRNQWHREGASTCMA